MKFRILILAIVSVFVLSTMAHASLTTREARLIVRTNTYRTNHGVGPVHNRLRLDRVARHEVRRMIKCHCLTHLIEPACGYWGQDIGFGITVRSVFRAFKKSVSHRHNLLNPKFHRIGVAARKAAGVWWVAMEFCGKR